MAIDLSENGRGYKELQEHVGHKITCVIYGDPDNPVNAALECETCHEVLVDFNEPEQPSEVDAAEAKMIEEYVMNAGEKCPACGSGNPESGNIEGDGSIAWANCNCPDCGSEWTDEFTLTGANNFNIPKKST